jgi:hypothetical protein
MSANTWLRIVAIGLPLIGVPAIWRWGDQSLWVRRWLAAVILGISGLAALGLFLLNQRYACILLIGTGNCLIDGLAPLSLFLLNVILVRGCFILRGGHKKNDYVLLLLLSSAWAGMGLAENLLVLLIFLYLFFYVIRKWLDRDGLKWRFLIVRDDYSDERNHYYDDPIDE